MSAAVSVTPLFAITSACLIGGVKGSQSVLWALHAAWLMKSGGREGSQSVHVSMCVRSLAWKGRHGSSPALNIPAITPPHSPDNLVNVTARFFPSLLLPLLRHSLHITWNIIFFSHWILPCQCSRPFRFQYVSHSGHIKELHQNVSHSGGTNLTTPAELHGGPMIKLSPFPLMLNSSRSSLLN